MFPHQGYTWKQPNRKSMDCIRSDGDGQPVSLSALFPRLSLSLTLILLAPLIYRTTAPPPPQKTRLRPRRLSCHRSNCTRSLSAPRRACARVCVAHRINVKTEERREQRKTTRVPCKTHGRIGPRHSRINPTRYGVQPGCAPRGAIRRFEGPRAGGPSLVPGANSTERRC